MLSNYWVVSCVTQSFVSVSGVGPDKLQLEFFINQNGPLRRLVVVTVWAWHPWQPSNDNIDTTLVPYVL